MRFEYACASISAPAACICIQCGASVEASLGTHEQCSKASSSCSASAGSAGDGCYSSTSDNCVCAKMAGNPSFPGSVTKTDCNEWDGHTLENLDRHDVSCNAGQALHSFKVTNNSCTNNGYRRFEYTCAKIAIDMPPGPTKLTTGCNPVVGENVEFLDRHAMNCADADQVLTSFKLKGTSNNANNGCDNTGASASVRVCARVRVCVGVRVCASAFVRLGIDACLCTSKTAPKEKQHRRKAHEVRVPVHLSNTGTHLRTGTCALHVKIPLTRTL